MLVLIAALGMIGAVFTIFGWRGQLVNNRPSCRYCKYDLGGTPENPSACPECGSDLNAKRAVRIGERRKRYGLLLPGVVILVLALALGGTWTWGRVTRFNWANAMPSWVLVLDARAGDAASAQNAIDELIARLQANELSDAHAAFLVDRALVEQADPGGEWFGKWDAVFEAAWNNGQVTEGQVREFANHFYKWRLNHRAVVRSGQSWAATEYTSTVRGMRTTPAFVDADLEHVAVGGISVFARDAQSQTEFRQRAMPVNGRRQIEWNMLDHEMPPLDLKAGTYEVVAQYRMWIFGPGGPKTPCFDVPMEFKSTIQVVEQDEPLVALASPENLRPAVQNSITFRPLQVTYDRDIGYPWCAADFDEPPIDVAFNVFFVIDEEEIHAGTLTASKGKRGVESFGGREYDIPWITTEALDVILRPSAELAERSSASGSNVIWGEEIVFEDVPVKINDRREN